MANYKPDSVKLILSQLVVEFKEAKSLEEKLRIAKLHIAYYADSLDYLQDDISEGVPEHEVWRHINSYEGIYQISNYGQIKGVESFFVKTTKGRTMAVYKEERIRTKRYHSFGYLRTSLWREEKVEHRSIHRIVAIHFIPNTQNYPQVLHIDNDASNAKWNNLKWGTQKMNIQQAVNDDRWHTGERNNRAKLKNVDIPVIRQLLIDGKSCYSIAKRFKINEQAIYSIRNNKTWVHIK